jgi:hypothetical protein
MIVPSETSETDVPPGTNHTPKQLVPLSKAARSKFGLESWEAFPRLETTVLIGNGLFRLEKGRRIAMMRPAMRHDVVSSAGKRRVFQHRLLARQCVCRFLSWASTRRGGGMQQKVRLQRGSASVRSFSGASEQKNDPAFAYLSQRGFIGPLI